MKNILVNRLDDLLWMIYPNLCAACGRPLFRGEECICTFCRYQLPRTNYHLNPRNPVIKHFWGKVPVRSATAYYHFSKGERVQRLVHQLKYKGRQDVGTVIGRLMGVDLRESDFSGADFIVPVPLHRKRRQERGYNQSECFAEGLAAGLRSVCRNDLLLRTEYTGTQTRKHRFDRFLNVDSVFEVPEGSGLEDKKILLVDDVITTGSTLISCAETILKVPGTSVFIAAIACA